MYSSRLKYILYIYNDVTSVALLLFYTSSTTFSCTQSTRTRFKTFSPKSRSPSRTNHRLVTRVDLFLWFIWVVLQHLHLALYHTTDTYTAKQLGCSLTQVVQAPERRSTNTGFCSSYPLEYLLRDCSTALATGMLLPCPVITALAAHGTRLTQSVLQSQPSGCTHTLKCLEMFHASIPYLLAVTARYP